MIQLISAKVDIFCSIRLGLERPEIVRIRLCFVPELVAVDGLREPSFLVGIVGVGHFHCGFASILIVMSMFVSFHMLHLLPLIHLYCSNKSVGVLDTDNEVLVGNRCWVLCLSNYMDKAIVVVFYRLVRIDDGLDFFPRVIEKL